MLFEDISYKKAKNSMTLTVGFEDIYVTVLIRECYGRFNSFRVAYLGMQKITDAFQFVVHEIKAGIVISH